MVPSARPRPSTVVPPSMSSSPPCRPPRRRPKTAIEASGVHIFPPCSSADHYDRISEIGDDLIFAILIRLPNPRSVFQCKLVCKRWSSLISNPDFARSFVSRRSQQSRKQGDEVDCGGGGLPLLTRHGLPLLTRHDTRSILSFIPVPEDIRSDFVVLSSSKELVLCGFEKSCNDPDGETGRLFFVCNPFTKQWIALPLAPKRLVSNNTFNKCLVCEPPGNLDSGYYGGNMPVDPLEYRFRVVLVSGSRTHPEVDLFCSESGKWMENGMRPNLRSVEVLGFLNIIKDCDSKIMVHDMGLQFCSIEVFGDMKPLWNGYLYWHSGNDNHVGMWNPFCPHAPPTSVYTRLSLFEKKPIRLMVSLGALHIVCLDCNSKWKSLSVRRWEEDGMRWRLLYEETWDELIVQGDCEFECFELLDVVDLHPGKPEVVFLECRRCYTVTDTPSVVVSCDLRAKKLEFFVERRNWRRVFQPRFTLWPTPIPRYEKLQGIYDGRYSCFVQSSNSTTKSAAAFDI